MNISRGIVRTLIWVAVGIPATLLIMACFRTNDAAYYLIEDADTGMFLDHTAVLTSLTWWHENATVPLIFVATYLGLTALATYLPKGKHGFARTLAILAVAGYFLIGLLDFAGLAPARAKSIEHPTIYLSEFLVIIVPPIVVAVVLITHRQCSSLQVITKGESNTENPNLPSSR